MPFIKTALQFCILVVGKSYHSLTDKDTPSVYSRSISNRIFHYSCVSCALIFEENFLLFFIDFVGLMHHMA